MATARRRLLAREGPYPVLCAFLVLSCDGAREATETRVTDDPEPSGETSTASLGLRLDAPRKDEPTSEAASPEVPSESALGEGPAANACPDDMVWVRGDYCPVVEQRCAEHHPEYLARRGDPTVSERCLRYAEPSRCLAPRRPMSFCMDRFEYPNRTGELPRVLTSWTQARRLCEELGKRLCDEDEFNFACEGPEMHPYATGFVRDPSFCNIDRPYRQPNHSRRMKTFDECPSDPWCSSELGRLDQRHAIGERMTCVSWAGVVDLNGNVNEWVVRPGQVPPHRSGLKGGWWGPVRNRCRPTVGFHKESDYGYEAGFRCCREAEASAARPGPTEPLSTQDLTSSQKLPPRETPAPP